MRACGRREVAFTSVGIPLKYRPAHLLRRSSERSGYATVQSEICVREAHGLWLIIYRNTQNIFRNLNVRAV
jgi:hypothetical protein